MSDTEVFGMPQSELLCTQVPNPGSDHNRCHLFGRGWSYWKGGLYGESGEPLAGRSGKILWDARMERLPLSLDFEETRFLSLPRRRLLRKFSGASKLRWLYGHRHWIPLGLRHLLALITDAKEKSGSSKSCVLDLLYIYRGIACIDFMAEVLRTPYGECVVPCLCRVARSEDELQRERDGITFRISGTEIIHVQKKKKNQNRWVWEVVYKSLHMKDFSRHDRAICFPAKLC